ncbi:ATP-binding protein [Rhodovulum sp. DZ06]|uniref:sensor histidine kinase NtrY-like n=1 Tax=Rhodovulum sp. DZ06 TaxID=3425126 RepID=UPI003D328DA5
MRSSLSQPAPTRRLRNWLALALVAIAPLLIWLTVAALSEGRAGPSGASMSELRTIFLADLVYIITAAGLLVWRMAALISARRAQSAGSRLHLRLTGIFALMALAPTIVLAVFATLTVSFGLEGWFSSQVGAVVRNALSTAQAYEQEHKRAIRGEILAMANDLNRAGAQGINDGALGELLRAQTRIREIPEAYVFDSGLTLRARGEFSYLFSFDPPSPEELAQARAGDVVIIDDDQNDEIRALVHLTNFLDYYLYVTRRVDGQVLRLLDETEATVQLYEHLERDRSDILLRFSVLYIGFAMLVILASIWLGLWFAERLARPIGRLAGAANRVGAGDLDVRVKEERGDDEIAVLSRVFNRMTEQVKGQRDALVDANLETERRRRFIEAVLSGVTAGVMRLDAEGRVSLLNAAAADLLGVDPGAATGERMAALAPLFAPAFERARGRGSAEDRVSGLVHGREREFFLRIERIEREADDAGEEGGAAWVVTFDDLTDLASAQRMAAWGDVARRIAHEIKNPLTPIQLSAERLKRKFGSRLEGEDRERFDQYAAMIVRQAGDIRRMVDEFSQFARMPAPELGAHDLGQILREAVMLQEEAGTPVRFTCEIEGEARKIPVDRGLVMQALTNLLKNAGEAVEARLAETPEPAGEVRAVLTRDAAGEVEVIRIIDNGVGLPANRSRLLEPYVTTREKGTGLGLAIVKKIAQDHDGSFAIDDAPQEWAEGRRGAMAVMRLPVGGQPKKLAGKTEEHA